MSDTNERSVASAGSVVAWAVMDGTKTVIGGWFYGPRGIEKAETWSREYGFPEIVPLYAHPPQGVAVRLPKVPDDFEISEANGYAAAIEDFKKALVDAGIAWTE